MSVIAQVNGKKRGEISIAADASQSEAENAAREDESVARALARGTVRKVIFVPGRIINFVVSDAG